jgi:hypothetical protein
MLKPFESGSPRGRRLTQELGSPGQVDARTWCRLPVTFKTDFTLRRSDVGSYHNAVSENIEASMDQDEKRKVGYQSALQLVAIISHAILATFQVILAANAFLLTIAGVLLRQFPQSKWLSCSLAVAGLLLCATWYLALARQFSYQSYYLAWARELEAAALGDGLTIVVAGRVYGEGASVKLPNSKEVLRMSWSARSFTVQRLTTLVILIFVLLYAFLFWASLQQATS